MKKLISRLNLWWWSINLFSKACVLFTIVVFGLVVLSVIRAAVLSLSVGPGENKSEVSSIPTSVSSEPEEQFSIVGQWRTVMPLVYGDIFMRDYYYFSADGRVVSFTQTGDLSTGRGITLVLDNDVIWRDGEVAVRSTWNKEGAEYLLYGIPLDIISDDFFKFGGQDFTRVQESLQIPLGDVQFVVVDDRGNEINGTLADIFREEE